MKLEQLDLDEEFYPPIYPGEISDVVKKQLAKLLDKNNIVADTSSACKIDLDDEGDEFIGGGDDSPMKKIEQYYTEFKIVDGIERVLAKGEVTGIFAFLEDHDDKTMKPLGTGTSMLTRLEVEMDTRFPLERIKNLCF